MGAATLVSTVILIKQCSWFEFCRLKVTASRQLCGVHPPHFEMCPSKDDRDWPVPTRSSRQCVENMKKLAAHQRDQPAAAEQRKNGEPIDDRAPDRQQKQRQFIPEVHRAQRRTA